MQTPYKFFLLLSICTAVLTAGCSKTGQNTETPGNAGLETASENDASSASIDFEAVTIDGTAVSADLFSEARLTMVNVWATYCNPCLSEMPGLGELAGAYNPEDFQLIGIISDVPEGAEEKALNHASDLVEQTGADYPHLLLNESLYRALLTEVSAVPTTYFINEEGEILDIVTGAMEKSAWEEKIDALLEK